ncbi:Zinc finger protein isoform 1 [Schistosoma japonicum]|uniref:Zinc finger protein isoform 1 n=1 Tax=Schistosoma japonicum TaxID=6182 RepID=A0A4Z2DBZ1_SCHJA|nr:Zinc finger protein isoform 1 [Schistosoma japonicum]
MFEPCYNNSRMVSSPQYAQEIPPISFRKRTEKIDWKLLASIDVNRIASRVDIESLQEILSFVTFCDITTEVDTRYVDNNLIKLFQLAQLLIEYLLYSQDYLTTTIGSLKEENNELYKNCEKLKQQLQEKTNRLTATRRECHRRRLLLMAQQQLMDSGPQSLHKCMYCPKVFVNASFLATHIHRRHPETETMSRNTPVQPCLVENNLPYPQVQQVPQQSEYYYAANNNMSASLERDVKELLNQLKLNNPNRLNYQHSPSKSVGFDGDTTVMKNNINADWHTKLMEEHRRDIEIIRKEFERELHTLQIQYQQTQEELSRMKSRPATSNLGELENDMSGPVVFRPSRTTSANASLQQSTQNRNVDQSDTSVRRSLRTDDRDSTVHASTISGSTTRFLQPPSSKSQFNDDIINLDDKDESEAQQVSRAMGRVLTASGGTSPTPSLNASTNMLRYSRLLDQLRSDPETLRKLRHEVEQLLLEQLNEHGIKPNQRSLSTNQLNQKLTTLRKERENLAKKHQNFMEIRNALSQNVDRLAHAALRGSTASIQEARLRAENIHKIDSFCKAGLPPPAAHSPGSLRKAGTLPLAAHRVDMTSNLGVSLPILPVNNETVGKQSTMIDTTDSSSRKGKGFSETTPRLQRSSPQLHYVTDERDFNTKSTPLMSRQNFSNEAQQQTSSQKYSPFYSYSSNNSSSINNNNSNIQQKQIASNSPEIHFSHDQRVVTFGTKPNTTSNLSVVPSSEDDEWDSETEDLNAVAAEINKAQYLTQRSTNKPIDPPKPTTSYSKSDNNVTHSAIHQKNNSSQGVKFNSYKSHNLKTDDEDIFSVSSINGGLAEDNSFSLAQDFSSRHPVGVSRSLDPSVAAAHAEAAALGPRPTTRVGGMNRQQTTPKHTSIGSPELSNTMATSLWGTNSKAASPTTNVISVARSDGAYDDLDSDDE